jgi:hypothetical protein
MKNVSETTVVKEKCSGDQVAACLEQELMEEFLAII